MVQSTVSRFSVGAYVWASRHRRWWHATILRANEDGTYRVRFHDGEASSTQTIGASQIAPGGETPPGRVGRENAGVIPAAIVSLVLLVLVLAWTVARDFESGRSDSHDAPAPTGAP